MDYLSLFLRAAAPILLLCTAAHAELVDTLYFNGSPVAVSMSSSLPTNATWSFGGKGTIVNEADRDGVTFGAFFPDQFNPVDPGGHGLVIVAATSATASTDTPWALDMWTANPACLRFDVTGDSDPFWNPPGVYPGGEWVQIGTVVAGYELLTTMIDAPKGDAFGIRDVPLGPWIVTGFQTESSQEMDGPIPLFDSQIIAAPEPATLAMFLRLIFARKRM